MAALPPAASVAAEARRFIAPPAAPLAGARRCRSARPRGAPRRRRARSSRLESHGLEHAEDLARDACSTVLQRCAVAVTDVEAPWGPAIVHTLAGRFLEAI